LNVTVFSTYPATLSNCTLSLDNGTGTYVNLTTTILSGNYSSCGYNIYNDATVGATINYFWTFFGDNGTAVLRNETPVQSFVTWMTPNGTVNFTKALNPVVSNDGWSGSSVTASEASEIISNDTMYFWYRTVGPSSNIVFGWTKDPLNWTTGDRVYVNVTGNYGTPFVFSPDDGREVYDLFMADSGGSLYRFEGADKQNFTMLCGGPIATVNKANSAVWYENATGVWYGLFQTVSGGGNVYYNSSDGCNWTNITSMPFNGGASRFKKYGNEWIVVAENFQGGGWKVNWYAGNLLTNLTLRQADITPSTVLKYWEDVTLQGDPDVVIVPPESQQYFSQQFYMYYSGSGSATGADYDSDGRSFYEAFGIMLPGPDVIVNATVNGWLNASLVNNTPNTFSVNVTEGTYDAWVQIVYPDATVENRTLLNYTPTIFYYVEPNNQTGTYNATAVFVNSTTGNLSVDVTGWSFASVAAVVPAYNLTDLLTQYYSCDLTNGTVLPDLTGDVNLTKEGSAALTSNAVLVMACDDGGYWHNNVSFAYPESVNMWVNWRSGGQTAIEGMVQPGEGTQYDYLEIESDGRVCEKYAGAPGVRDDYCTPAGAVTTNAWYMVTFVIVADDNVSLYIDGVSQAITKTTIGGGSLVLPSGTNPHLNLGGMFGTAGSAYIDEFGRWERVLLQDNVTALYNGGLGFNPFSSPLPDVVINMTDIGWRNASIQTGVSNMFSVNTTVGVSAVWAQLQYPNATSINKTLLNYTPTIFYYVEPNTQAGTYNVTGVFANSTTGNVTENVTGWSFVSVCAANWTCVGYASCPSALAACNAVNDTNSCGGSYTGNYSEFPKNNSCVLGFSSYSCPLTYPVEDAQVGQTLTLSLNATYPLNNTVLVATSDGDAVSCVRSSLSLFVCNVTRKYWKAPGFYDFSANATDGLVNASITQSGACEYGELFASQRVGNATSCPNAAPGVANSACVGSLVMRNTGNVPVNVSMRAYDIPGVTYPSTFLPASAVKSGTSLGSASSLTNGTTLLVTNLLPAQSANATLSFWVSMSSGQQSQAYLTTTPWQTVVTG